ncbi:MAG: uncharacterized protein JWN93_1710, partial [Hyphomicrobiales bacterium]|nr:uncharacterized protein [Hyphomicrobiales bacterium]
APARARARPDGLSTRGIGNTLRARWLAGRGKGVRASRVVSRVPERPVAMLRAPSIAVGMGEAARPQAAEIKLQPVRLASLGFPDAPVTDSPLLRGPPPAPRVSCAGDAARIRNYAAKVAEGVAGGPSEDLKLFDAQGMPTDALRRVMANMASVEIGPMKASPELISFAIAKQVEGLRAKAETVSAAAATRQAVD